MNSNQEAQIYLLHRKISKLITKLKYTNQGIVLKLSNIFFSRQEYIDLYVDYVLNKSVAKHFDAFNQGFHKVCGGRVLRLFQSHELMDLVVGKF